MVISAGPLISEGPWDVCGGFAGWFEDKIRRRGADHEECTPLSHLKLTID